MATRFTRLTRPAIRRLKPGEKITEAGITAERLRDSDVRYSVNIMVNGERVHRVIGRESEDTTRTQAEDFISKTRADAREGRLSLPKGRKLHLTFMAAADLYLKHLKEIGGKDYDSNEQHIRLHLKPYLGKMRLDRITTFTLQKLQKHLVDKGLSEATSNRVLTTYRRMARRLFDWRKIPAPLPMVKLPHEANARDYVISDNEEAKLLAAALQDSSGYIWLFVKIGLATGLRHAEIVGARFDQFDPVRRRLRVRAKGGRLRNQPLTKGITEILQREREMAQDRDGWIFPSSTSKSGHIESMAAPFARCVEAAGMDPTIVVPHVMRHTAITRLAGIGADLKTLQEFSGHRSVAMVMRYAHAQDRAVDLALERMEGRTVVELPGTQKGQKS